MSNASAPLDFTLNDHDILIQCATGINEILRTLGAMDARVTDIEKRVKNVEDWKIRVMAIVGAIGVTVGFIFGKLLPFAVVMSTKAPHLP